MHHNMYMIPGSMPYDPNVNRANHDSRLFWGGFGFRPWGWGFGMPFFPPFGFGFPFGGFGFGFPFFGGFPFFV
ncbi:hypothetical protein [Neobacillus citreus]|uniref:Uncharacterized protein n=1 Tax=Neobacillus citreus TaxID=2833578 RepID=A0A942YAK9_9BACI|nr:hypothetical protein [Neobacillus citreus]MCH6268907.1 hypothetical protein [Neobacillus citreus]